MDFSRFFILLNSFNVFGRYPGKVKEPKITGLETQQDEGGIILQY